MGDFKENLIKDMMQTLSEHSSNGVYITDKNGMIYINKGFANMFGYPRKDILNKKITLRELVIPDHLSILDDITNRVFDGETAGSHCQVIGIRKNGEHIYLNIMMTSDVHSRQNIIVGSIIDNSEDVKIREQLNQMKQSYDALVESDIKERKKAMDEIRYAAYYDHVTELPNRRMFREQLDKQLIEAIAADKKIALLLIDVKRFKLINNSLGHRIGDALIQQLVNRLKSYVAENEAVYRIAGDKFCIVLTEVENHQAAFSFSERIFETTYDEFLIEGYRLNIRVRIGISLSPQDGNTVDGLFRSAETALYFSESGAKDQIQTYSSALSVQTFRLFSLINDLPNALENNELFLQYMPRVDTNTTRIVGTEALVRWRHPDWGIISPVEFIPIAEETGLIIQIGEWVLREACAQNKRWLDMGYMPIAMSVNFSASQLLKENILQTIDDILEETRLSPEQLEIELTESLFISNESKVAQLLYELKKRKIKVSLDDFGTGYSSLYSLKRLRVDSLKIDKSFIDEIFTDPINQSIIQNIMSLARELGMGTVAEGVETIEQYTFMKTMQCDEIQGYYFSHPLDASELPSLLAAQYLPHQPIKTRLPEPIIDQREDLRMELTYPLIAKMTIVLFKGQEVNLEIMEVFVKNICSNGLKFLMGVKLPVSDDIVMQFSVDILDQSYEFRGNIVWFNEVAEGEVYAYGVRFS